MPLSAELCRLFLTVLLRVIKLLQLGTGACYTCTCLLQGSGVQTGLENGWKDGGQLAETEFRLCLFSLWEAYEL